MRRLLPEIIPFAFLNPLLQAISPLDQETAP
jgi:hypothetical protein